MSFTRWLFAALLLLQAHFAASFLVPLDREAQREFGGLLRWVWPWSDGDSGLLGQLTVGADLPLIGLFLAMVAGSLYIIAVLAVIGLWVPFRWWRVLAGGGAIISLLLMAGFFGATKLIPMVLNLGVVWAAVTSWLQPPG